MDLPIDIVLYIKGFSTGLSVWLVGFGFTKAVNFFKGLMP